MSIKEELLEFKDDIKEIKELLINNSSWINQAKHDLYGNGKKGLITRVEELEDADKQDEVTRAKIIRIDATLQEAQQELKHVSKKVAYFSGIAATIVFIVEKLVAVLK